MEEYLTIAKEYREETKTRQEQYALQEVNTETGQTETKSGYREVEYTEKILVNDLKTAKKQAEQRADDLDYLAVSLIEESESEYRFMLYNKQEKQEDNEPDGQ